MRSALGGEQWTRGVEDSVQLSRPFGNPEFRYNRHAGLGVTEKERGDGPREGIEGKRLTYRRPNKAPLA